MNYLEKLYLQAFVSEQTPRPADPQYKTLSNQMSELEAQLRSHLAQEELQLLDKLRDAKNESVMYELASAFSQGVKFRSSQDTPKP